MQLAVRLWAKEMSSSSLMGAINAMEPYQKSFGLSGAGSSTGIVFITYNLGQIAAVCHPYPCASDSIYTLS